MAQFKPRHPPPSTPSRPSTPPLPTVPHSPSLSLQRSWAAATGPAFTQAGGGYSWPRQHHILTPSSGVPARHGYIVIPSSVLGDDTGREASLSAQVVSLVSLSGARGSGSFPHGGDGDRRGRTRAKRGTAQRSKRARLLFVCGWLLNVPATCECISGTDLRRPFYVLPY